MSIDETNRKYAPAFDRVIILNYHMITTLRIVCKPKIYRKNQE